MKVKEIEYGGIYYVFGIYWDDEHTYLTCMDSRYDGLRIYKIKA